MTQQKTIEGTAPALEPWAAVQQSTADGVPTYWLGRDEVKPALRRLKYEIEKPYECLYDLTVIDERERGRRTGQPESDFSLVYHLLSYSRNEDLRLKVPLRDADLKIETITDLWPTAAWYEREAYDMFGVGFEGHRHLRRILMPETWKGHPLRREHPARATEMEPFELPEARQEAEQEALRFDPERFGLEPGGEDSDYMFLNAGPQHPGTHGVLRIILQLDGEEVVNAVPEIGFHHRGAEKMAERQTWHTFIPYTDRVDYLAGVLNNLPYLLAVEKLAGIEPPERAQVIRVMLCELFRVASHLVWYGTFAQDVGQMTPVFLAFNDRERVFDIIEAICGARMHPNWFRIGGVAQDLPEGWDAMLRDFIASERKSLDELDVLVMQNRIFKGRTQGIGDFTKEEAIDWGVTGPGLRACGVEWDLRKKRPYSGYENFEFDVPTAEGGDCYSRAQVRVEEIRQSLRIIEQCVERMPGGPYQADHPLATPPRKAGTMKDIETLIAHFLSVSWGPVIPAGEAFAGIESAKGAYGYYLISDGGTSPYRARIRAPSFAHMQTLPFIARGFTVQDLLAILGAMDYVLADVDR